MARLIFVSGPMVGQVVDLVAPDLNFGRDAACGVVLQGDAGVSRNHAKVFKRDVFMYVVDLGSRNGTAVNGQIIGNAPAQLRQGDMVQMCNHVLRFEDAAPAAGQNATQAFVPQAPAVTVANPPYGVPQAGPMPMAPMMPHEPVAMGQPMIHGGGPVVVNQNMIQIQGKNNLTWLWVLLCIVALGPCGIFCLGMTALALMPFAMVVGGLALAIIGFFDYRRFSPYPQWYEQTKKATIKLVAGVALTILGGLWIGVAWFGPKSQEPLPRPSGNVQFR